MARDRIGSLPCTSRGRTHRSFQMNRVPFSSLRCSCLLVLATAILPATGCTRSLDMAALDKSISDGINTQLQLPIATVNCPTGDRALKAGDTFDCIATPKEGGRLTVTV